MVAFTVDSAEFRAAVCKVVRVVPESVPVPVLKGILIVAGEDAVEVLATDYKVTHRASIAAEVKIPGRVLVDAEKLARIARNLPAEEMAFELDRATLTLSSDRTRYGLLTMPENDYPTGLPADADLSKVRAAGPDSHERELIPSKAFTRWKPPARTKKLYDPQDFQPGAAITWFRKVGDDEWVEVSGQVWSGAPRPGLVWAVVEGERHPSLVTHRSGYKGTWGTDSYRTVDRMEETKPHWVAFPKATPETERKAA